MLLFAFLVCCAVQLAFCSASEGEWHRGSRPMPSVSVADCLPSYRCTIIFTYETSNFRWDEKRYAEAKMQNIFASESCLSHPDGILCMTCACSFDLASPCMISSGWSKLVFQNMHQASCTSLITSNTVLSCGLVKPELVTGQVLLRRRNVIICWAVLSF